MQEYRIENVFDGEVKLNDQNQSHDFNFDLDYTVDASCPGMILIRATGVDYTKNRVALNDNFIGYLRSGESTHLFETDNGRYGRLKEKGNTVVILVCDAWGDRKSVANLNVDDITIYNIDVAYVSKP